MLSVLEALLRESSAEPAGIAARALVLTALAKLSARLPGQGEAVAALLRTYQGSIHLELQQVQADSDTVMPQCRRLRSHLEDASGVLHFVVSVTRLLTRLATLDRHCPLSRLG